MKAINYQLSPEQKKFTDQSFPTIAQQMRDEMVNNYEEPGEDREEALAEFLVKTLVQTKGRMKVHRIARKAAEYFHLKRKQEVNAG